VLREKRDRRRERASFGLFTLGTTARRDNRICTGGLGSSQRVPDNEKRGIGGENFGKSVYWGEDFSAKRGPGKEKKGSQRNRQLCGRISSN